MKARVAERGQVTIPKRLRGRLGVMPGTVLEFSEEHGRLIAVKSGGADPVREVYGCLGKEIDTDASWRSFAAGSDHRHRYRCPAGRVRCRPKICAGLLRGIATLPQGRSVGRFRGGMGRDRNRVWRR